MSEHIAWARYVHRHEQPTRIELRDSDAEGAFQVYAKHAIDTLQARIKELEKDAGLFRKLESAAKESPLRPEHANSDFFPDKRTFWQLPVLICSGPIGGYVTFAEAVDRLDAAIAKESGNA